MLWSPNEDRLVIQAATCVEDTPDINSFYFVLVDMNTSSQTEFLTTAVRRTDLPKPLEWTNYFPYYIDRDYSHIGQDKCWEFNLMLGELQSIQCP